jgi:hypothetical protein
MSRTTRAFRPRRHRRALVALVSLWAMVGCAAKDSPPATAPAHESTPAQQSAPAADAPAEMPPALEAADPEAALDRAEMDLEAALGDGFAVAPGEEALSEGRADACATACRALSSMQNAADHLCEISEDEGRCADAKDRVARAQDRVEARCATCD